MTMNPADRYAALRYIREGLDAVLPQQAEDAEAYRVAVGAKALATPWGDLSPTKAGPPTVDIPDAGHPALLDFVFRTRPDQLRRVVCPAHVDMLKRTLRVADDGETVIDESGEVIPWARVRRGRSGGVVFRMPQAVKDAAAVELAARVQLLAEAAGRPEVTQ